MALVNPGMMNPGMAGMNPGMNQGGQESMTMREILFEQLAMLKEGAEDGSISEGWFLHLCPPCLVPLSSCLALHPSLFPCSFPNF